MAGRCGGHDSPPPQHTQQVCAHCHCHSPRHIRLISQQCHVALPAVSSPQSLAHTGGSCLSVAGRWRSCMSEWELADRTTDGGTTSSEATAVSRSSDVAPQWHATRASLLGLYMRTRPLPLSSNRLSPHTWQFSHNGPHLSHASLASTNSETTVLKELGIHLHLFLWPQSSRGFYPPPSPPLHFHVKATSAAIKITVCLELKPADLTFSFSLADEIVFWVCCYGCDHFSSHHQLGMKPSLLINNIHTTKVCFVTLLCADIYIYIYIYIYIDI